MNDTATERAARRPFPRPRSLGSAAALIERLLPAATGVFVALAIEKGRMLFAAAPLAAAAAFLISRRSWAPYLIVLVAVGTFAEPYAYPQFSFLGFNPFLSELLFIVALGATLLMAQPVRGPVDRAPRTVQFAVGLFLLAAAAGILVGRADGATVHAAILDMRPTLFVAAFWLALPAFGTAQSRRRVFWIAGLLTAGVVGLQFAQIAVGASKILFYSSAPFANLVTCPSGQCLAPGAGFIRVRPPGLTLAYVAAAFSCAYLLWGPQRRRLIVGGLLVLSLGGVFASLNRNMVLGLVLGLSVATVIVPNRSRLGAGMFAVAVVVLLLVPLAESGALGPAQQIFTRAGTLIHPHSVATSASIHDRSLENHLALRAIRGQPLVGIGWGTSYGKTTTVLQQTREIRYINQPFIHSLYLGIWLRTGILGLIAYLTAVVTAIVYGARWCRRRTWDGQSWLGAAVVCALVANSFSAAFDVGTDPDNFVPVAGVLALAVTLAQRLRLEGTARPSLHAGVSHAPR